MTTLPSSIGPLLRHLSRRIALGQFLEIWPLWAAGSLLAVGTFALLARIFFASLAFALPWLWLAPLLAGIPAAILCRRRAYRPAEIAALADSLSGGTGTLLFTGATGSLRGDLERGADGVIVGTILFLAISDVIIARRDEIAAAIWAFTLQHAVCARRSGGF